jgi:hypothetical protein
MGPDWARYQEELCWRRPAVIYWKEGTEGLVDTVSDLVGESVS